MLFFTGFPSNCVTESRIYLELSQSVAYIGCPLAESVFSSCLMACLVGIVISRRKSSLCTLLKIACRQRNNDLICILV